MNYARCSETFTFILVFSLLTVQLKKIITAIHFFFTMLVINIQIIQESKVLFGWKVIPVQTDITIEQFFLELVEEHMLNDHLDH